MSDKPQLDVSYIAKLARIELSDDDKLHLQREMEDIVGYIEQLNEVDTTAIEPTAHAVALTNVMRDDQVQPSFPREQMLSNAPDVIDDELIKVPQVLPGSGMA